MSLRNLILALFFLLGICLIYLLFIPEILSYVGLSNSFGVVLLLGGVVSMLVAVVLERLGYFQGSGLSIVLSVLASLFSASLYFLGSLIPCFSGIFALAVLTKTERVTKEKSRLKGIDLTIFWMCALLYIGILAPILFGQIKV